MATTTLLVRAAQLSDQDLLARVQTLARAEREATAALIAHLAVLDQRRLYRGEGCGSLFAYCTQVLLLSDHATYDRIQAARAVHQFPILLELIAAGAATLTTVTLLAPQLTAANHKDLLEAAAHKSKRQVQELVARIQPQPPVPPTVRRLPVVGAPQAGPIAAQAVELGAMAAVRGDHVTDVEAPSTDTLALEAPSAPAPLPSRRPVIEPFAPQQYRVQFTASAKTYEKLRLAQDLLRRQIPDGDVEQILDRALTALVELLTKKKFAATPRPHGRQTTDGTMEKAAEARGDKVRSRHIPAEVKRQVWLRDGGQCGFIAPNGRRCTERIFLEFHHKKPYAAGGEATIENVELRCRAHNDYEAELFYGQSWSAMVRETGPADGWRRPATVREAGTVYADNTDSVGIKPHLASRPVRMISPRTNAVCANAGSVSSVRTESIQPVEGLRLTMATRRLSIVSAEPSRPP